MTTGSRDGSAFIFDLESALLNDRRQISPEDLATLDTLSQEHEVYIITEQPITFVRNLSIPVPYHCVCCGDNDARVYYCTEDDSHLYPMIGSKVVICRELIPWYKKIIVFGTDVELLTQLAHVGYCPSNTANELSTLIVRHRHISQLPYNRNENFVTHAIQEYFDEMNLLVSPPL